MGDFRHEPPCNSSIFQRPSTFGATNIPNIQTLDFTATGFSQSGFWPGYVKNSQNQTCTFLGRDLTLRCHDGPGLASDGFLVNECGVVFWSNPDFQGGKETDFFWACPAKKNDTNIRLTKTRHDCVELSLSAPGCPSSCDFKRESAHEARDVQEVGCPKNLCGVYEFPHLIVPIDSTQPNTALANTFSPSITSTVSTIFNFDIPYEKQGQTCSLIFLFPSLSALPHSYYTFTGSGYIEFTSLDFVAFKDETTYANAPRLLQSFGAYKMEPGGTYRMATWTCQGFSKIAFEMRSVAGTALEYFQDSGPEAGFGMFITTC